MPSRKRLQKETFSATEVGTLLETLRNDIRVVAEGVADIRKEVEGLKVWRTQVDAWRINVDMKLDFIKKELQSIRADMKAFDERLRAVEAKVGI